MPDRDATDRGDSLQDSYERLVNKYSQVTYLDDAKSLLEWDEQTVLPEGGRPARSKQLEAISAILQERRSDSEFEVLLSSLETGGLTPDQEANVREIRREYDRLAARPANFSERLSEATSEAKAAWEQARANDEFDRFEPHLERIVDLKREEAAALGTGENPYATLVSEYAPYTELETIDRIFDRLRERLVPLLGDVRNAEIALHSQAFDGSFDPEAQVAASEALLDALGYDRDRGYTDTVANAVTVGNQYDCRIGLWPIEDQLKICILGTIHEFGHALYTHNLSQDHYGTPLGADRGIYVQESQAAFWDSQIARTKSFWEFAQPILSNYLPSLGASARELFESYVHVQPEQPNPLLTDEMSFQLHTLVRYEIEKQLINGELDVTEIPRVWRDLYEEYLGFRPESDAEGPLLTIHWAAGNFGYFPTYTLGHVLAAQFGETARESIADFDARIREGEFEPIQRWLQEEIHRHGQRYPTPQLIQRVTGSELTAEPFLEYVTEKYSNLYDL